MHTNFNVMTVKLDVLFDRIKDTPYYLRSIFLKLINAAFCLMGQKLANVLVHNMTRSASKAIHCSTSEKKIIQEEKFHFEFILAEIIIL